MKIRIMMKAMVLVALLAIFTFTGCDVLDKADELKKEISDVTENLEEVSESAMEAMEEITEEIEELESEEEVEPSEEGEFGEDETTEDNGATDNVETEDNENSGSEDEAKDEAEYIDSIEGAILDFTNNRIAIESVQIFEEDEALDLPRTEHNNYLLIKGEVNNKMNEERYMDGLYNIFVYDETGDQVGDASSWLAEGNMHTMLDPNGTGAFQRLFLYDKTAKTIDVQFYDWPERIYKYTSIDVEALNTASVEQDNAEATEFEGKLKEAGDRIIGLVEDDRYEEIADLAISETFVMPGPNVTLEQCVYLYTTDWAQIETYEEEVVWGHFEGSGEPMTFLPKDLFDAFVTQYDFRNAPEILMGSYREKPDGYATWKLGADFDYFILYHYPGFEAQYEGIDYQSLVLTFIYDEETGQFLLNGIANEYWTI